MGCEKEDWNGVREGLETNPNPNTHMHIHTHTHTILLTCCTASSDCVRLARSNPSFSVAS